MSLAPAAYLLYQRVMNHDPGDVHWPGRDRFILSAGHSSLTQYVQLYLGGFGLELDDLKSLRTWGSKTPGHPEYGHTDGVEITTGPLGQGLASSVGFAYAARYERGLFDPETPAGQSPFDHFIYVIASDGDLQEGVTSEASSPGRPPVARQPRRRSTTRTRSRSRTTRTSPSPRTSPSATNPMAGTCRRSTGRRPASTSRTLRSCIGALEAAKGETDKPSHHHPQDDHRLALPRQAEHRQDPRLRARRRRAVCDEEGPRLGPGRDVRRSRGRPGAHPQPGRARRDRSRRLAGALRRVGGGEPGAQGAVGPRATPASCPRTSPPRCPCSRPARTSRPVPRPAP